MGKFRSKLKGQTKGKRWPKGQSSSSNPEIKKHRDLAKSRFFQENLGPSNLTSDALKKHDSLSYELSNKLPTSQPSKMDTETAETVSTYKTSQTFASDWSECSNASFSRLMQIFKPNSALHKEMLSVLAAITEVIKQNGGNETSTEYYAALMTTLEVSESEMNLAAILSLLNMGIKNVPRNILQLQFGTASKIFIDLLNKNESVQIIKALLNLLTAFLRALEIAVWSNMSTLQILGNILAFTAHNKPKVRKTAQSSISAILKASSFMLDPNPPFCHPASKHVANFCIQQINISFGTTSGQTVTLHTLTLLKDIIHVFPKSEMKKTCETILKIMTVNNILINLNGLQVLHSLFTSQKAVMDSQLNVQLINALYEYQPSSGDIQATLAWLATLTEAVVHLGDVDEASCGSALPKMFEVVSQLWLTEKPQILTAVTHSLQTLLENCVGPHRGSAPIEKIFNILLGCLSYQYNKSWHLVLHVLSIAFKNAPDPKICSTLLSHLAELRDSFKFSYNNELEHAIGSAIKHLGPETVLKIIPLVKNNSEIDLNRSWLLPILKENIQNSTLEYFAKNIIPLSILCDKKSKILSKNNDCIAAHSYELLFLQLWSLLPSFCKFPIDLKENFKNIAKILGTALNERKELRLCILTSIRKLIQNADNSEKIELGRFAKNFVPILFNIYTQKTCGSDEESQKLSTLETVKTYLTVSPLELTSQLFKNALETLKSLESDSSMKAAILDLIRCLVTYQTSEQVYQLYSEIIKNSLDNENQQKKVYKLLEEILKSETKGCKSFLKQYKKQIQSLLIKTVTSAAVPSRSSRLKCQNYFIKDQPNLHCDSKLFKAVIPEAVLCCKDINEKCRNAASNILISIGEILEKHGEIGMFISMLLAGLTADTPEKIEASVLALAIVVNNFTSAIGQENLHFLLATVSQLMTSSNREIVGSCLIFLKTYLQCVPLPIVAQNSAEIVKSLISIPEDCQKHFRLKIRDLLTKLIRKFGAETISAHIPPYDVIMHKRIRNIRKMQERKKRQKQNQDQEDNEYDSEEEFTIKPKQRTMEELLESSDSDIDDKIEEKPRKVNKTYIQEIEDDFIDFTDPSAAKKITSSLPTSLTIPESSKKKDQGFKISSDGRIIIENDSNDEKIQNLSDSESEDFKSTAILTGSNKRKRETDSNLSFPVAKYRPGGSGIHRDLKKVKTAGFEYKNKKAAGDVKRKGQVDPYAYLPLSRQLLNKRKRMKSAGKFKGIVKGAKNGARKGKIVKRNK